MPPKKAPVKGTPGKTTAERKEFVWSDEEVQLLLEAAANCKVAKEAECNTSLREQAQYDHEQWKVGSKTCWMKCSSKSSGC